MLKGAFVFMADLVRALGLPAALDFVGLSSYGRGTESCGTVRIWKRLQGAIAGKTLVVEDILDTGLSMRAVLDHVAAGRPRFVRICALLDKRVRRTEAIPTDYVGFALPDGFVVDYGIDCAEPYRELPAIYRLDRGAGPAAAAPRRSGPPRGRRAAGGSREPSGKHSVSCGMPVPVGRRGDGAAARARGNGSMRRRPAPLSELPRHGACVPAAVWLVSR